VRTTCLLYTSDQLRVLAIRLLFADSLGADLGCVSNPQLKLQLGHQSFEPACMVRRQYSIEPSFGTMMKRVETGDIPTEQAAQWNLYPQCWSTATPDLRPTETSARWVPNGL